VTITIDDTAAAIIIGGFIGWYLSPLGSMLWDMWRGRWVRRKK